MIDVHDSQVERLEQQELHHVKFHSSDAEQQRRQRLLALERGDNGGAGTADARGASMKVANSSDRTAAYQQSATTTRFHFDGADFGDGIIYHLGRRAALQQREQQQKQKQTLTAMTTAATTTAAAAAGTGTGTTSEWLNPGRTGIVHVTRSSDGGGEACVAVVVVVVVVVVIVVCVYHTLNDSATRQCQHILIGVGRWWHCHSFIGTCRAFLLIDM